MQYVGEIAHKLNKRFNMRRTGYKDTGKHGFFLKFYLSISMKVTAKTLLTRSTY